MQNPTPSNLKFIDSTVKMPLLALPVRSTIVKMGMSEVLLSPGSQIDNLQYDPKALVTDIVATSLFHAAGIAKASKIYPNARVWGVSGIEKKYPQQKWDGILGKDVWPYESELSAIPVRGMPAVNEFVFLHSASKSLIVTDLCFNLLNASGLGAFIFLSLFGTYKRFGVSRFYTGAIKDRHVFQESMQQILIQDFDNIIVSHGENLIGGAKEKLRIALHERGLA